MSSRGDVSANSLNSQGNEKRRKTAIDMDDEQRQDDQKKSSPDLHDIKTILDGIRGTTSTGGPCPSLPSAPALAVKDIGIVPLPLNDTTANSLISVSQQSPHGRGMQTVMDTSVRNSFQIEPDKVEIQNPAWEPALLNLTKEVATSLGVEPDLVKTELYKLLIYEKGGFFKKHRDTEKADGMFGTLVIQLPSLFTGGSFVVSHGETADTYSLGSGKEALYGCHFIAHYADCEHEINSIESGYRLALVYSLCYKDTESSWTAEMLHNSQSQLSVALKSIPPKEQVFLVPLEHLYTSKSIMTLGVKAFKGVDRGRYKALALSTDESWKMMILKVTQSVSESGTGDTASTFSNTFAEDNEEEEPEIHSVYFENGAFAATDKWGGKNLAQFKQLVSFKSFESEGGMLLACEDFLGDVWKYERGEMTEITGNDGSTRWTLYSTYVLLVHSEDRFKYTATEGTSY